MNVFVYGTLMWPDIWRHKVRSEYSVKDATVNSFICKKVKKETYPALIRSRSKESRQDIVQGKVYFEVNQQDFIRVKEYIGKQFEVIEGVCFIPDNNIPVSAKIFLWKTEYKTLLSNEEWTKERFEDKALNNYRREMNQSLL